MKLERMRSGCRLAITPKLPLGTATSLLALALAALLMRIGIANAQQQAQVSIHSLARLVNISIGGETWQLPLVAISWGGRSNVDRRCNAISARSCVISLDEIERQSVSASPVIAADHFQLVLADYNVFRDFRKDRYVSVPELCPVLPVEWARRQCSSSDFFPPHLRRVSIVTTEATGRLTGGLVGGHQISDLVAKVQASATSSGKPEVMCPDGSDGICVVVIQLNASLLAVWTSIATYTDAQTVNRDAKAVRNLMNLAKPR
jgi:hypothetical protein